MKITEIKDINDKDNTILLKKTIDYLMSSLTTLSN